MMSSRICVENKTDFESAFTVSNFGKNHWQVNSGFELFSVTLSDFRIFK